jgi:hypothetical protein
MGRSMRALILIQPWASLIADGRILWFCLSPLLIETRSWPTKYRGTIAIHAGANADREACIRWGYDPKVISCKAVIAVAELYDCVCFPDPRAPEDEYGDFSAGRFGFLLRNVQVLEQPVSVGSSLGLWNWQG